MDDVLTTKGARNKSPVGWEPFSAALKKANVSSDLVQNPIRWSFISGSDSSKKAKEKRKQWIHDDDIE